MGRNRRPAGENKVGHNIRARRLALGLTQAELAEAVGLTVESLSRAERGAILPTVTTLSRLASVLDTSIDSLADRAAPLSAVASARERARSPEHARLHRHIEELDDRTVRRLLALVELLPHAARRAFPRANLQRPLGRR